MNHLEERLHLLADDVAPPTDDQVRGDLVRSHRALRRRRVQRGAAGLVVAAFAVGGTVAAATTDDTGGTTPENVPALADPREGARTGGIDLVAYTGEQEDGFVVEKVPEGFVLQGATKFNLNVARPGDDSHLADFRGKLVVMLESSSVTGPPKGDPVQVGELDGWIRSYPDGTTKLTYVDGEHRVVVQSWFSLGLTDEQVVEFAEGVTVTSEAQAGIG